jgi:hypothetical protein
VGECRRCTAAVKLSMAGGIFFYGSTFLRNQEYMKRSYYELHSRPVS